MSLHFRTITESDAGTQSCSDPLCVQTAEKTPERSCPLALSDRGWWKLKGPMVLMALTSARGKHAAARGSLSLERTINPETLWSPWPILRAKGRKQSILWVPQAALMCFICCCLFLSWDSSKYLAKPLTAVPSKHPNWCEANLRRGHMRAGWVRVI